MIKGNHVKISKESIMFLALRFLRNTWAREFGLEIKKEIFCLK